MSETGKMEEGSAAQMNGEEALVCKGMRVRQVCCVCRDCVPCYVPCQCAVTVSRVSVSCQFFSCVYDGDGERQRVCVQAL